MKKKPSGLSGEEGKKGVQTFLLGKKKKGSCPFPQRSSYRYPKRRDVGVLKQKRVEKCGRGSLRKGGGIHVVLGKRGLFPEVLRGPILIVEKEEKP